MNGRPVCLLEGEDGRSLPAVLIALTVGVLLITPLLSGSSTGLLGTRAADQALLEQFSLDSGVEFAIWRLRYDPTFRALVDSVPLTPRNVGMGTVNGYTPSVTAMARNSSGWDTSPVDTPNDIRAGGALTYLNFGGTNYLFAFRGSTQTFWRYNVDSPAPWQPMANYSFAVANGAALTSDGTNYVYGLRGNQRNFRRYTPNAGMGTWTAMASIPLVFGNAGPGGSLAYANGYVYALRGNGSDDFMRYTPPPTNSWAIGGSDPPDPPGNVGAGGALVHIGGNTFYALQGGGQTGFWKWVVGWASWQARDPAPAAVNDGGAMVYSGGDFIYAFRGGDTPDFWRYNILSESWDPVSTLPPAPAAVDAGGAMAYPGGDYIYALRGDPPGGATSREHWRYRVAPPQYDIVSISGTRTITSRIQIDGSNLTVLFWDVQ